MSPEIPFDDMYALIEPVWYENPSIYLGACLFLAMIGAKWWFLRWLRRQNKRKKDGQRWHCPERTLSSWSTYQPHDVLDSQRSIYRDLLAHVKRAIQECYTVDSTALTDTELKTWMQQHMAQEDVYRIQCVIEHAQHVRFQAQTVDTDTVYHDYMIVNEIASCIRKGTSHSRHENTC